MTNLKIAGYFGRWAVAPFFCLVLAACGGGHDAVSTDVAVSVIKSQGARQCELGVAISLEQMQSQLKAAGVQVLSSSCGLLTNLVFAAVCGGGDGRIGILEVPLSQVKTASDLGFTPLPDLSSVQKVACR